MIFSDLSHFILKVDQKSIACRPPLKKIDQSHKSLHPSSFQPKSILYQIGLHLALGWLDRVETLFSISYLASDSSLLRNVVYLN